MALPAYAIAMEDEVRTVSGALWGARTVNISEQKKALRVGWLVRHCVLRVLRGGGIPLQVEQTLHSKPLCV